MHCRKSNIANYTPSGKKKYIMLRKAPTILSKSNRACLTYKYDLVVVIKWVPRFIGCLLSSILVRQSYNTLSNLQPNRLDSNKHLSKELSPSHDTDGQVPQEPNQPSSTLELTADDQQGT